MTLSTKLQKFLENENVEFHHLEHQKAFTATEVAAAQHIPGDQMIKAILVRCEDHYILCVLTANQLINFDKLKKVTGAGNVELATEQEVKEQFPDVEPGSEPPFGVIYGLKTYVDEAVAKNDELVFNGGTHRDTVKLNTQDYLKLAKPITADFCNHI